jgi:hypothetical protein
MNVPMPKNSNGVVKLMEMDTEKHLEILEFVRHHARKSSAG